jgi:hypothetical protein
MPNSIAIAVILAIVAVGVLFVLQIVGRRRKRYNWQPDLSYRAHELSTIEENNSTLWLTEKSAEER